MEGKRYTKEEYSAFFKNFPHRVRRDSFSEISIIYDSTKFVLNFKTKKVTLGFRPYDYNLKPAILASLTRKLKSKFGLVDKYIMYVAAPEFRWLTYEFYINKPKDLNQIIEILNPILLLGKLSK